MYSSKKTKVSRKKVLIVRKISEKFEKKELKIVKKDRK